MADDRFLDEPKLTFSNCLTIKLLVFSRLTLSDGKCNLYVKTWQINMQNKLKI